MHSIPRKQTDLLVNKFWLPTWILACITVSKSNWPFINGFMSILLRLPQPCHVKELDFLRDVNFCVDNFD